MSRETTIVIWYKNESMNIPKEVADLMGISRGYRIKSEKEFWAILEASASHNINRINLIKDVNTIQAN